MSMAEPVLRLKNISKTFSGVRVLKDVQLDLYPGEIHCLMGENGAGKSTLIKIISGAYAPDQGGTIEFQGKPIPSNNPRYAREHGINTIYQEIDLVPDLNATENVMLGNEPLKKSGRIDWAAARQKTLEIFREMNVTIDMDIPVGQMKVAQQQMVAIAKALLMDSKVIIFDEPTAVFTENEVELLFRLIRDLKKNGLAILYISHHLDEIFVIGDRITVLRDGELIKTDTADQFTKAKLIHLMVGRDIDVTKRFGKPVSGEVVMDVQGLTQHGVVENVSFQLHAGEILGFGGLVGAGRTEMAQLLIGMEKKDAGVVTIHGKQVHFRSPRHAMHHHLGMLPENRKENGLMLVRTVGENMMYSYIENTYRTVVPWKSVNKVMRGIMSRLNVKPSDPSRIVRFLSGGNQQKVVLGKLLAADCEILILDEPTRGVDVGARVEIYERIRELKDAGKAILMISSDMTELLTQSDRIVVMSGGRIVGELDGATATEVEVLSLALNEGGASDAAI